MTPAPALKPCPFCGVRKHVQYERYENARDYEGRMICGKCGAEGPSHGEYESGAMALWNDRRTPTKETR